MTEGEIRQVAQMYALVAEMEAVKARVEGMKAENAAGIHYGTGPQYWEGAFAVEREKLVEIAKRLRDEI